MVTLNVMVELVTECWVTAKQPVPLFYAEGVQGPELGLEISALRKRLPTRLNSPLTLRYPHWRRQT